jgi:hypothetical protein
VGGGLSHENILPLLAACSRRTLPSPAVRQMYCGVEWFLLIQKQFFSYKFFKFITRE